MQVDTDRQPAPWQVVSFCLSTFITPSTSSEMKTLCLGSMGQRWWTQFDIFSESKHLQIRLEFHQQFCFLALPPPPVPSSWISKAFYRFSFYQIIIHSSDIGIPSQRQEVKKLHQAWNQNAIVQKLTNQLKGKFINTLNSENSEWDMWHSTQVPLNQWFSACASWPLGIK